MPNYRQTQRQYAFLSNNVCCNSLYVFGYRYLGAGDTDRREILRNGTYRSRTCLLPF